MAGFGKSSDPYRMRAHTRYPAHGLRTADGVLLDLSASGMRFMTHGKPSFKPGHIQPWTIRSEAQALNLAGRVCWVRRAGLFGGNHQVGVQFLNLKPAMQSALEEFAAHGFIAERGPRAGAQTKARVETPDLYAMLGVERDASDEQLHEAYRKAAKATHPDVCKDDPDAAQRFELLTKAYEVLADTELRRQYDQTLKAREVA
jgi:hypothetical protein